MAYLMKTHLQSTTKNSKSYTCRAKRDDQKCSNELAQTSSFFGNGIILHCNSCRDTVIPITVVGGKKEKQERNDFCLQNSREFTKVNMKSNPFVPQTFISSLYSSRPPTQGRYMKVKIHVQRYVPIFVPLIFLLVIVMVSAKILKGTNRCFAAQLSLKREGIKHLPGSHAIENFFLRCQHFMVAIVQIMILSTPIHGRCSVSIVLTIWQVEHC